MSDSLWRVCVCPQNSEAGRAGGLHHHDERAKELEMAPHRLAHYHALPHLAGDVSRDSLLLAIICLWTARTAEHVLQPCRNRPRDPLLAKAAAAQRAAVLAMQDSSVVAL